MMTLQNLFKIIGKSNKKIGNFGHKHQAGKHPQISHGGGSGGKKLPSATQNYKDVFGFSINDMKPRSSADDTPLPSPKAISTKILNDAYNPRRGKQLTSKLRLLDRLVDIPAKTQLAKDYENIMKSPGTMKPAHTEILNKFGYGDIY